MTRRLMLLGILALVACADRQIDVDQELAEIRPTCMVLPARGYWDNGSGKPILNESGTTGSVCMCMTEEELHERVWVEELNDRAYEECKRIERLHWDFDWTECEESYKSAVWINAVIPAVGDMAWLNHDGLDCDDEVAESCSIAGSDGNTRLMPLLVVIVLAGVRRRG